MHGSQKHIKKSRVVSLTFEFHMIEDYYHVTCPFMLQKETEYWMDDGSDPLH